MTYFAFLAWCLGIPLIGLIILTLQDRRRGRTVPDSLRSFSPAYVVAGLVVAAVVYTTPWDNYLVATGVWRYNPKLVTGIVLGWVPLEEYLFFILQTILTSLLLLSLARRIPEPSPPLGSPTTQTAGRPALRRAAAAMVTLAWLLACAILLADWRPGVYLGLELVWALPPIMIQLIVGADILWHYRRIIFWSLLPVTLYLWVGDALAIASGTWTINLSQSTGILIGPLPLEEMVFFLTTNMLITFGLVLLLARASRERIRRPSRRFYPFHRSAQKLRPKEI